MSVGHVQRVLEAAGLPTVGVYVEAFGHVPERMRLARALITPHPMGRPLGAPGDRERHQLVVRRALELFDVTEPTTRPFPEPYRTWPGRPVGAGS